MLHQALTEGEQTVHAVFDRAGEALYTRDESGAYSAVNMSMIEAAWRKYLIATYLNHAVVRPTQTENIGYLAFTYDRCFLNVVNPRVGSYVERDYSQAAQRDDQQLIVKYGLDHFYRYKYDRVSGHIEHVNTNPEPYDLFERSFYKDAVAQLSAECVKEDACDVSGGIVWLEFTSGKGDPRRAACRRWAHGIVLASVEGG